MATVSKWTPFGVALDITATGGTVTRKSATQYTVKINASWETYYSGAQTNYGMTASSGGGSVNLNTFGKKSSSGSGSFTGTYSISGNGSSTKTVTVTFKNYEEDWQGNVTESATKSVSFSVKVPAWTSYTVKYNANGGSGAPSSQTKWKDQTLKLSTTKPTRTGYTFQGWATSASGSVSYASGANYTANASVTLYAVWKAVTYTVKYNANGGSGAPSSQTKTYGKTLTLSSIVPTRTAIEDNGTITEYTFKGWATSSTSTSVAYKSGASYTANASVTLYAVWSKVVSVNLYDVSYNTNGGSEVISQIKTKGETLKLRDTIPVKNGYTFDGWCLSLDATTSMLYNEILLPKPPIEYYNSGQSLIYKDSETYYFLYADWLSPTVFRVDKSVNMMWAYFDGDCWKLVNNNWVQQSDYTSDLRVPSENIVWCSDGVEYSSISSIPTSGSFMAGTEPESSVYLAGSNFTLNRDVVLYAIWTPWSHTVTFDADGGIGNVPENLNVTTGNTVIIPDCSLTKRGYVFKYWSTQPSGSGGVSYYAGDGYTGVKNGGTVVLYAIWDITDIYLYYNGECKAGEFIEDESTSFNNDGTVHYTQFIEGNSSISLNSTAFYVAELLERVTAYLTDELDVYLVDESENYLTAII